MIYVVGFAFKHCFICGILGNKCPFSYCNILVFAAWGAGGGLSDVIYNKWLYGPVEESYYVEKSSTGLLVHGLKKLLRYAGLD